MADENNERVDLNSLSDDAYQKAKEQGHVKFKKLFNGELVVNKTKDYLMNFKKEFKKALSLGYTYTEIANVIRDEKSGVTFTARQIREFCEENEISLCKKKKNDNGIPSGTKKAPEQNGIPSGTEKEQKQEQNDGVISTGNRNRPKAKA